MSPFSLLQKLKIESTWAPFLGPLITYSAWRGLERLGGSWRGSDTPVSQKKRKENPLVDITNRAKNFVEPSLGPHLIRSHPHTMAPWIAINSIWGTLSMRRFVVVTVEALNLGGVLWSSLFLWMEGSFRPARWKFCFLQSKDVKIKTSEKVQVVKDKIIFNGKWI